MVPPKNENITEIHNKILEQCKAYKIVYGQNAQLQTFIISIEAEIKMAMIANEQERPANQSNEKGNLSEREFEVLNLVAKGFQNKEIAYQLDISERTVQFHLKSVFEKLHVSSRTEAVTNAIKSGIITL